MNSHLIDGVFARSFLLLGSTLWGCFPLWDFLHESKESYLSVPSNVRQRFFLVGFLFSLVGRMLLLWILLIAVLDISYDELVVFYSSSNIFTTFFSTQAGVIWLFTLPELFFLLGSRIFPERSRARTLFLGAATMFVLFLLTATGHGVEDGVGSFSFLTHFLHVGSVLFWLSGICVLCGDVLCNWYKVSFSAWKKFSQNAGIIMGVIVGTGMCRIIELPNSLLKVIVLPYGGVLVSKLLVFCSLLLTVLQLRKKVQLLSHEEEEESRNTFEGFLSIELFLAFVLLFLSTLLSQLSYE